MILLSANFSLIIHKSIRRSATEAGPSFSESIVPVWIIKALGLNMNFLSRIASLACSMSGHPILVAENFGNISLVLRCLPFESSNMTISASTGISYDRFC